MYNVRVVVFIVVVSFSQWGDDKLRRKCKTVKAASGFMISTQMKIAKRPGIELTFPTVKSKLASIEAVTIAHSAKQKRHPFQRIAWLLAALCALAHLTGCVTAPNGFNQFYQDVAGADITNLPPYSGSTKIYPESNPTNDMKELYRSGYTLIGASVFQGPAQPDAALERQAKKVGADVVLFSCSYLGGEAGAVPWLQSNPGQTFTTTGSGTVSASAAGGGGYVYGTGNSYGTSTMAAPGAAGVKVIPGTVHRYQYEARFFRSMPPTILGLFTQPLPDELRRQLGGNTGVVVWVVRNGSPAAAANILEGDVILKVNGEDVLSVPDFVEKFNKLFGQKVEVQIWRTGQFKTISVQLNNQP
jgi:hypothetical protein